MESKVKLFRTYFSLLFVLSSCFLFAQNTISGKVLSEDGTALLGANITITDANNRILVFGATDDKGIFDVKLPESTVSPVFISAKRLEYAPIRYEIVAKSQHVDLVMFKETTVLEEVIIDTHRPVSQKGDTIRYHVDAFAEQKDRNIGDVLAKLPGIDVLSDGRVLYQGRPIEKYYIEGMDLLEGKYNLVNSNLPHVSVTSVEILENHQPIRVLDSLTTSDRTSLNIRLKEEVTLTGVANIAAGAKPLLWETNITPMLFKKNKQAVFSYQANNSGVDSGSQLKTLTLEDIMEQMNYPTEKFDFLKVVSPSIPAISSKRFLDNNVHLFTANFLSKFKNKTEVRFNLSYVNDYQKQEGSHLTRYFLPQGDLVMEEGIRNRIFTNDLQTNLTLHKNTKKSFLKNSFKTQFNWDSEHGVVQMGNTAIDQYLRTPYYSFSNQLKWITPIGKQLMTFYSIVNYNRSPQELYVLPGQFKEILNDGNDYETTRQKMEKTTFQTNNYLGYDKKLGNYTIGDKWGFSVAQRQTDSQLFKDGSISNTSFLNNQRNIDYNLYVRPNVAYKYKKWEVKFQIPLAYQEIHIEDKNLNKQQKNNGIVITPKLGVQYSWTAYWKTVVSVSYNNNFQDAGSILYGFVMKNYRSLQMIDYPIEQGRTTSFNIGVNYRNPIKSIFFSSYYLYSQRTNPFLFQNKIQEDGTQLMTILERENTAYNHTINAKLSKYYNGIRTTVSLGVDLNFQQGEQMVNTTTVTTENNVFKPTLNVNTRFSDKVTIDYKTEANFRSNKTGVLARQNLFSLSENIHLNVYPKENQYLGFSLEHYYHEFVSSNNHNLYADFTYRYTITKTKIDLELRVLNLFNENTYVNSNYTDFYFYESVFKIRPRQVMLGVKLSF